MKHVFLGSQRGAWSWRDRGPMLLAVSLASAMVLFLTLPFMALAWRAITLNGQIMADIGPILSAVLLSLATTAVTVVATILLGTPLAYFLARYPLPLKRLLITLIEIPIVMPPVVAGLALLSTFGRRGLLGQPLTYLDINITFTTTAVVLAQLFVSAPFYIRAAHSRFESLPRAYEEAAAVDGASRWLIFWHVILPQSKRALLAGLILSWARALGEFGATILFAGNLQGRTQTMPLLVYSALEQDLRVTFVTALILLGLAVIAFATTRWLAGVEEEDVENAARLETVARVNKSNGQAKQPDQSVVDHGSDLHRKAYGG